MTQNAQRIRLAVHQGLVFSKIAHTSEDKVDEDGTITITPISTDDESPDVTARRLIGEICEAAAATDCGHLMDIKTLAIMEDGELLSCKIKISIKQ
jgi:hypothetical protein